MASVSLHGGLAAREHEMRTALSSPREALDDSELTLEVLECKEFA